MTNGASGLSAARTVLEQKIRERRETFEEFAEYAERFAREHNESGTLSVRHLQRLAAGRRSDGTALGPLRPATSRLLEHIFGMSIDELLGPGSVAEASTPHAVPSRPDHAVLLTAPPELAISYLREQWHLLVRADNLFGPARVRRLVHAQIELVEAILWQAPHKLRPSLLSLGAEYAESAAWLHEDAGEASATFWTGRALEWARAAGDDRLVAWVLFRRSQQVAAERDASQAVGLAQAARGTDALSAQMRAAITQQEAYGLALDGDEAACQRTLDKALGWAAADDTHGDARSGHGAFCTDSYIELRRAECWQMLGQPQRAVPTYQTALAGLPEAYHRDRGHGLAQLAGALVAIDEPEQAANAAAEALAIASGCGSDRTLWRIRAVARQLRPHARLPAVAQLFAALAAAEP